MIKLLTLDVLLEVILLLLHQLLRSCELYYLVLKELEVVFTFLRFLLHTSFHTCTHLSGDGLCLTLFIRPIPVNFLSLCLDNIACFRENLVSPEYQGVFEQNFGAREVLLILQILRYLIVRFDHCCDQEIEKHQICAHYHCRQ
jgi:hypothetical protein